MTAKRIILGILFLAGAALNAYAQSSAHNYVKSVKCTASDGSGTGSVQYYDGLGRPDLQVRIGATSDGKDLCSLTEYDAMDRDSLVWRPLPTGTTGGAYVNDFHTAVSAYMTDAPYTLNGYETSPMNRITERTFPGAGWHSQGKSVRTAYGFNASSGEYALTAYRVRNNTLESYTYGSGELRVLKTRNEDGKVHYTFTDKDGRTVLERDSVDGGVYDTRYAYDECGNLRYVLPPGVEGNLSATSLAAYAYSYEYDDKGRCVIRKQPGRDPIETVYDYADRIVMERDGNRAEAGRWTYCTYDSFGRLSSRSEVNDGRTRAALASLFGSTSYSYTADVAMLLEQHHYDDYSFLDGRSDRIAFLTLPDGTSSYSSQGGCGKSRLLGTVNYTSDSTQTALWTVYHYDHRGNVVFQVTDNLRGGYDKVYTTYTYSGNPATVQYLHSGGSGDTAHSVCHTYSYHPMTDLVQTETVEVDGVHAYSMAYTYDDFMRLVRRTVVAEAGISTSYTYNVRDWMTGTDTDGLFTESLSYSYGGNIASQQWVQDGKTRSYAYTYDGLDRLASAAYTGDGNYSTAYTYDRMGNITSLQRYDVSLVDNLTYTYSGNQLTKVEDATGNSFGFANGASQTTEYFYDSNGNLTKDSNKGIASITYNSLNLPSIVTFSDGSTITYLYTADGKKLRTIHVINGITTQTDYCGNVLYENGVAKTLLTEAGYVDLTDNSHHFYIKDHQGNNRVVADGNGNVVEVNHYYPFGGVFEPTGDVQRYKYNGKEYIADGELNWYDYGTRHYDPAIGRFTTMDPLAEKYYSVSPYAYCDNNPVRYIDPTGKAWKPIYTVDDKGDKIYSGYEWIPESESYNKDGSLKNGLYSQAIFFSDNGTFDSSKRYNMGSSTAYVYLADGSINTFEANTHPSNEDYAIIPEGIYHAKVGMHNGSKASYTALRMSDIDNSNRIELGKANPAFKDGRTYAIGINIHKPGLNNLTGMTSSGTPISEGCLLIDRNKWDEFIGIFDTTEQRYNQISVTVSRSIKKPLSHKK